MSGTIPVPSGDFQIVEGQRAFDASGVPYVGPLPGINSTYIDINPTNLTIAALTPGVFINSGSGNDTLTALAGRNYLDGGTGNNVLIGASGVDSFEVAAGPTGSITDVIQNFHAGDDILVTGLTASDFRLAINTSGGALDITATSIRSGGPTSTLILPGYSAADVVSDRIAVTFSDRGMIVLANT